MKTVARSDNLRAIYDNRFADREDYRRKVWNVLIAEWFGRFIPARGAVLDLGCGHGEFINQVSASARYAMDLNPASGDYLHPDVHWFQQDCSTRWPLADGVIDVVFSSNFFEHLSDKSALLDTLHEAHRCLRPGGRLIALGPNIKYVPGAYWDFWDHHVPLTDASLAEVLQLLGFKVEEKIPRFLPYTMSEGTQYPLFLLRAYLRLPIAWRFFGRQFLIVAEK